MVASARYFDLVGEINKNVYNNRVRVAESAEQRGIKPTAQFFATTVPSASGSVALPPYSNTSVPDSAIIRKSPRRWDAQLVELRKTLHRLGVRRLIREFDLPIGHCVLERILREYGLIEKPPENISANRNSHTSKLPGGYSSKSA